MCLIKIITLGTSALYHFSSPHSLSQPLLCSFPAESTSPPIPPTPVPCCFLFKGIVRHFFCLEICSLDPFFFFPFKFSPSERGRRFDTNLKLMRFSIDLGKPTGNDLSSYVIVPLWAPVWNCRLQSARGPQKDFGSRISVLD